MPYRTYLMDGLETLRRLGLRAERHKINLWVLAPEQTLNSLNGLNFPKRRGRPGEFLSNHPSFDQWQQQKGKSDQNKTTNLSNQAKTKKNKEKK